MISSDLDKAVELLNREEVIAIPTETVYGLAGNIYSEKAIRSIFRIKERPLFNPLIVHVHSLEQVSGLVARLPPKAAELANAFWPGPLTLILPKRESVPDLVTGGKSSVAVRMPNHPVALELLRRLDFPLAAPSANPFGSISPTTAEHVEQYFGNRIPMVLEGGPAKKGLESTILGLQDEELVLYRLGSIALEEIEALAGPVRVFNKKEDAPDAPGMLARHYAPGTPTLLVDDIEHIAAQHPDKRIGVLSYAAPLSIPNVERWEQLGLSDDFEEAAARLYAALHELDHANLDLILAQRFEDRGLGRTINDRLERATKSA